MKRMISELQVFSWRATFGWSWFGLLTVLAFGGAHGAGAHPEQAALAGVAIGPQRNFLMQDWLLTENSKAPLDQLKAKVFIITAPFTLRVLPAATGK